MTRDSGVHDGARMNARVTARTGPPPTEAELQRHFAAEGLTPHAWSSPPGFEFDWHAHPSDQLHYCLAGGITFHTEAGDLTMSPGDRLDLPAGTRHAAIVGPDGITMLEADR